MDPDITKVVAASAARARADGVRIVDIEHVLDVLLEWPSAARDVLAQAALTPARLAEIRAERENWDDELAPSGPDEPAECDAVATPRGRARDTTQPGPSLYLLQGWVAGFAAGAPDGRARVADWLLGLLYLQTEYSGRILAQVGTTAAELVAALRERGVRVPAVDPPLYQPWGPRRHLDISAAQMRALRARLARDGVPAVGSRWEYAAWPGEEDRYRFYAEEGVDLPALLAAADGAGPGEGEGEA